ncbi:hypothetical protein [Rhizobium tubonense]|uniref:Uncharacterized protein n=1 Tax=Rhizobium tubonense TaxID=484088 RepID=A0A2W4C3M4_9HYPH|nr:hypothetical protein [Rhizobium tubonense]PZM08087.1 hypothetical protein CPY51_30560 [Rhizobium tubonense]
MPEHARIYGTNFTHAADELVIEPALRKLRWMCIGCDAEMNSVAWDPKRTFKMSPHFRIEGSHDVDCDGAEFRRLRGGAVYIGRHSDGMPKKLRLLELRDEDEKVSTASVAATMPTTNRDVGSNLQRPRSDGTFNMIARSYVMFPKQHHEKLEILNWKPESYKRLFWRLLNYGEMGPPEIPSHCIFFGPVATDAATIGVDNILTVFLRRGWWQTPTNDKEKGRWGSRFSISVDLSRQKDRHKKTITNNVSEWIAEQRQNSSGNEEVCAFFIGHRETNQPLEFVVPDPRLLCFLATPKTLFAAKPSKPLA